VIAQGKLVKQEQLSVNIWDTSDEKRTGGPGHISSTTYTNEAYCSTYRTIGHSTIIENQKNGHS
jgi:hypothetical protein